MARIVSPEAIASYPHLFEPRPNMSTGAPEYSVYLVFEPGADLSEMKKLALETAKEKFGSKTESMIKSGTLRMPFRDGSEKYGEGFTYMNVKAKSAPGIVSRFAGPDGKPQKIEDPSEIYAGVRLRASLSAYAYDVSGNRGVAFGLNNVQKLRDGERIDGRMAAESEFDALESADTSGTELDELLS